MKQRVATGLVFSKYVLMGNIPQAVTKRLAEKRLRVRDQSIRASGFRRDALYL